MLFWRELGAEVGFAIDELPKPPTATFEGGSMFANVLGEPELAIGIEFWLAMLLIELELELVPDLYPNRGLRLWNFNELPACCGVINEVGPGALLSLLGGFLGASGCDWPYMACILKLRLIGVVETIAGDVLLFWL